MNRERTDRARGILSPAEFSRFVTLTRLEPPDDLCEYVEHFWSVSWDLPEGRSFESVNLPYPCIHVVFDPEGSYVQGVVTGRFTNLAIGSKRVVSAKIRAGMGLLFTGGPLSRITDRRVPLADIFGPQSRELEENINRETDVARSSEVLSSALRRSLDRAGNRRNFAAVIGNCRRARDLVEMAETDRSIKTVSELAALACCSERNLQALFRSYVGVGPKWVISRFRIIEAVEQLHQSTAATTGPESLAGLAIELGYTDQAHFTRDFRALTGRTPGEYRAAAD